MSTHQQHTEKSQFYFVTFTCYQWLPLIQETDLYDYFEGWSVQLAKKKISISGYVIMPNHVHLLVYIDAECKDMNKVMGDSKRFLAYEIVRRLKSRNAASLLNELSSGVQENEKKKGKKHQVFRLSFDAKAVYGQEEIENVLTYIHHNPCSGKWNLADDYLKYSYSSAAFYEVDATSFLPMLDYREKI